VQQAKVYPPRLPCSTVLSGQTCKRVFYSLEFQGTFKSHVSMFELLHSNGMQFLLAGKYLSLEVRRFFTSTLRYIEPVFDERIRKAKIISRRLVNDGVFLGTAKENQDLV